jgi:hypothetical protein
VRFRLALLRAAFSRDPRGFDFKAGHASAAEPYTSLPEVTDRPAVGGVDSRGRLATGAQVRCKSSGRFGKLITDTTGRAAWDGVVRVLWDGNTGGVYQRVENLEWVGKEE